MTGHKKQWQFLQKKIELGQLSHTYIFSGPKDIGKLVFAKEVAKTINCLGKQKPCGQCVNCQLIEKENFPDLMVVKSKTGEEISISKIREVQNFLSYKPYYGVFKIVAVESAEMMNQEAQNCFLKTLEEPKGNTLIVLISSQPALLLPTITSRCQTIKFFKTKDTPPNLEKEEREKKILNEVSTLFNADLAEKFKYVKALDLDEQNASLILEVMQKYMRGLLLKKIGAEAKDNKNILNDFSELQGYSVCKIRNIISLIEDIRGKLNFSNANPKLALEVLLMEI